MLLALGRGETREKGFLLVQQSQQLTKLGSALTPEFGVSN